MQCPCWRLKNSLPTDGLMPLSYCKYCGGNFTHHYQKATCRKLRFKKVKSFFKQSWRKNLCFCIRDYKVKILCAAPLKKTEKNAVSLLTNRTTSLIIISAVRDMRSWRNRQTRTFEGRMGNRPGSSPGDRTKIRTLLLVHTVSKVAFLFLSKP